MRLTWLIVTLQPYGQFDRRFGHRVEGVELCDCPVERLELDRRIKSCIVLSVRTIVKFLLLLTALSTDTKLAYSSRLLFSVLQV